jgi:hypothetical protein
MTIEARLADGTVLNFPEGTDPAVIQRVVQQQVSGGQSGQRTALGDTNRSISQVATDFFQRAGDATGFIDEMRAAGWTGVELAGNLIQGEETEGGIRGAWSRAREYDREMSELAEQRQGAIERLASDTLGLGTTLAVPAAAAPAAAARTLGIAAPVAAPAAASRVGRAVQSLQRGLTMPAVASTGLGRATQSAGYGGLGGGIFGYTQGDTLQERSENALGGMALGTVAGAGIGGAIEGVAGLARGVRRALPANTPMIGQSPRQRAIERASRRLSNDDLTAEQAQRRILDMQRSGVDRASLLESGPSMRGLGRVVRDQPGAMVGNTGRSFDDFIETRMQDMPGAIRGQLDDAFIPQSYRLTFPDEVVSQYETAVRQQAGPFFQQVRGAVSGQSRTLQQLLRTPSGQRAFRQASLVARDRGMPFVDVYDEAGGLIDDMPDLDINFLHLVRQQLDDMSGVATRQGAPRGTSGITSVRQRLDRIMKAASPELRQADQFYSTLMRGSEGARIGQRFDTIGPARTLREWVRTATPEQLMLARIQAANRLGGRIQDMANPTTQLRSGGNRLEAIRALFGSQSAADDFARHIEAQRQIARTMQEVSGGSMTSRNLAQQDYEGMQLVAEGLGDFASGGGFLTVLRQNAARLIRRMPFGRMGDAERRALIDILTETDPERLALIFGEIGDQQASTAARQAVQGAVANSAAVSSAILSSP